jgi:hypothetical protein
VKNAPVFVYISAVERAGLSSLNEGQVVEYFRTGQNDQRRTSRFSADFVLLPPADHCGFDGAVSFHASPYAIVPSAKERKRLVCWRHPLMNESIDALLPGGY